MKKALLILLALCMIVPAGCRGNTDSGSDEYVYTSEIIVEDVDGNTDSDKEDGKDNGTSSKKDPANNDASASTSKFKPNTQNGLKVDGSAGTDKDADYSVKGTVTVAVSSYRPADYEAMFDAMCQVYKDIDIVLDYRPRNGADADEVTNYLTARALAGNMPDVLFDSAGSVWSDIANGWVAPLDDFVKGDAQFANVTENLRKDYTYGGKLYALPHQAHHSAMVLNNDVLEDLNLKAPKLDWTPNDMVELLKKGTTDEYSGAEYFQSVDRYLAGSFGDGLTDFGYDYRNYNFNKMGSSYKTTMKLIRDLRAIPGLEAYQLRFSSSGGTSDYVAKFGNGDTSNMAMAFHLGKTLFHFDQGTWSLEFLSENKFDWELIPYPQYEAGKIPIHIDCCYMLAASKNKPAAFQVLRYMTYSTEGNLARLSMYDKANAGKYKLNSRVYYPTSFNKDVANKFASLPMINDVDMYWYNNTQKGYRVDPIKIVPGWSAIQSAIGSSTTTSGQDIDSLVNQLISKGNKVADAQMADFNAKLKKVQAEYKG